MQRDQINPSPVPFVLSFQWMQTPCSLCLQGKLREYRRNDLSNAHKVSGSSVSSLGSKIVSVTLDSSFSLDNPDDISHFAALEMRKHWKWLPKGDCSLSFLVSIQNSTLVEHNDGPDHLQKSHLIPFLILRFITVACLSRSENLRVLRVWLAGLLVSFSFTL